MERSESIIELAKALVSAQGEFKSVAKNEKNPFYKSTYSDLPAVVDAVRPILAKHELCFIHLPQGKSIECIIMHSSGQYIAGVYPLITMKDDPQALGSAVTYAKRYSLMAMLGIASNDDDGEAAMDRNPNDIPTQPVCPICGAPTLLSNFKDNGRTFRYCTYYKKSGCKGRVYLDE